MIASRLESDLPNIENPGGVDTLFAIVSEVMLQSGSHSLEPCFLFLDILAATVDECPIQLSKFLLPHRASRWMNIRKDPEWARLGETSSMSTMDH